MDIFLCKSCLQGLFLCHHEKIRTGKMVMAKFPTCNHNDWCISFIGRVFALSHVHSFTLELDLVNLSGIPPLSRESFPCHRLRISFDYENRYNVRK